MDKKSYINYVLQRSTTDQIQQQELGKLTGKQVHCGDRDKFFKKAKRKD